MTVSVARASGDSDLTVSGGASLTFTSANWNTPQTVTLAAAEDVDLANGSAVFDVTSAGLTTVSVTGTEADNDTQSLVVSSTSLSVTEGLTNTFTVRLAYQPAANVTVSVARASGDSDLTVSGGASLTFTSANWNTPQTVTLAAAEDVDLANGSAVFDVTSTGLTTVSVTGTEADNDVLTLTFSLNTGSVSENAGVSAATGTVTRNDDDLSSALEVTLDSNDTSAATVPTTVTILAGQTSATFDIAAVDDLVVDGTQTVTFTASAANYVAGTSNLDVTDDDVLTLTVSLNKTSVSETAGKNAATGTVSRNSADLSSALVVTLASNDTSEATVPATVTILAGESSATFTIAAIDDAVIDGTQVVTFTASVTSYESGTSNLNLTDNELSLPVISGPETQVSSLRPVISWTASEGATSYEIWIRNQSTATNPFHTGTSTGTSYTPDVDLGIGKFNLWVRARGPAGDSPWTAQLNFTINTAATLTAIDRWQSDKPSNDQLELIARSSKIRHLDQ